MPFTARMGLEPGAPWMIRGDWLLASEGQGEEEATSITCNRFLRWAGRFLENCLKV